MTVRQKPDQDAIREVAARVDRLDIVDRVRSIPAALGWRPFQMASRSALSRVPLDPPYDLTLLEQEVVEPILSNPQLRTSKVALRVHNDEAAFCWHTARSEKNPLLKAYHLTEGIRFRAASRRVFRAADQLWFISQDHRNKWAIRESASAGKAYWLPPPVDISALRQIPLTGATVLFVGNLVAATNIEGVNWYLENVHPSLRDVPGYRFRIAGALLGRPMPESLKVDWSDQQVSAIKDEPDLRRCYNESAVFVNPMRHGVSLKLKTLNAVENGLPVVTSTVGNEGTGFQNGTHVLVRDSAGEFASGIRLLLGDLGRRRDLVASAQRFLAENYNDRAILDGLLHKSA